MMFDKEREPDFVYTQAEAILDGLFRRVTPDVLVTEGLWGRVSPDALRSIVEKYRAGVYADPPEADTHGEATAWLAYYHCEGVQVWAHGDEDGMLTLTLPKDY
jgi:hypothetical protein